MAYVAKLILEVLTELRTLYNKITYVMIFLVFVLVGRGVTNEINITLSQYLRYLKLLDSGIKKLRVVAIDTGQGNTGLDFIPQTFNAVQI